MRSTCSVSLEPRYPVGVDLIGLSAVPDEKLPVRRKVKVEMVEHLVRSARWVGRQLLIANLTRFDAVGGEPVSPALLELLYRGDEPTDQLLVVVSISASWADGFTGVPQVSLQSLRPRHRLSDDVTSSQVDELEPTEVGAQQLHVGHCSSCLRVGKVTDQLRQGLGHDPSAEDTIRCGAGGPGRSNVRCVDPSVTRSCDPPVDGIVMQTRTVEVGGRTSSHS
jgi:hypothetical protein